MTNDKWREHFAAQDRGSHQLVPGCYTMPKSPHNVRKPDLNTTKPASQWEQYLARCKREGESQLVVLLAKLADKEALNPVAVAKLPSVLDRVGLEPADITEHHIQRADALLREFDVLLRERVAKSNPRSRDSGDEYITVTPKPSYSGAKEVKKLDKLFGYPPTAVLRWMGKAGWKVDAAHKAITALGITVARPTVIAQISAGKKGQRGAPAELTESQVSQLTEAAK